jgi:hypothetical protein
LIGLLPLPFIQQTNPLTNSLSQRNIVYLGIRVEPKFILFGNGNDYPLAATLPPNPFSHPDTATIYKNDQFVKMKRQARESRLAFIYQVK